MLDTPPNILMESVEAYYSSKLQQAAVPREITSVVQIDIFEDFSLGISPSLQQEIALFMLGHFREDLIHSSQSEAFVMNLLTELTKQNILV